MSLILHMEFYMFLLTAMFKILTEKITDCIDKIQAAVTRRATNGKINPYGLQAGNVYIINTWRFNDSLLGDRRGSMIDVMRLISVLHKFHMHIESIFDAKLSDVKYLMEKIESEDFRKASCLMLVIMSHGYEGNIIAAKDGTYSLYRDIMFPILRNRSLASKFKLLVIQSCKGSVDPMQFKLEGPAKGPSVIPSEILQLYSCVEGYPSYLNPETGSVFINTLCDNLEEHGFETDILSIARKVVFDVKKKFCNIQIPMIHTNLTEEFVLGHYVPIEKDSGKCDAICSSVSRT